LSKTNFSDSESVRSTASEWSLLRKDFLLFVTASGIVWIVLYSVYSAFPFVQNAAEAISARKVDFLTTQPVFSVDAKIRILAFGNSKIVAGLNPAVFSAASAPGVEIFNAARGGRTDFVVLLKRILARGTRPTHLLVQVPPLDEHEESWRDYFAHDKLLVETLFPFRSFPRDLVLFLVSSLRDGGIRNTYKEHARTLDQVIVDRGYYFIKRHDSEPLPDDYRLPKDNPNSAPPRLIDPDASAFRELVGLSEIYQFKVIFIPVAFRIGEVASPDPKTDRVEAMSQLPNFFIAGPPQWVFDPRYFSDPDHLNIDGAQLYSRRLAELTAPVINSTD
jgi:hypothetical protein